MFACRTTNALWLAATLGTLPWAATAGVIRGVVTLPAAHRKFSRIGRDSTGTIKRRLEGVGDAIVYVDSIPEKVDHRLAKQAREPIMVQRRGRFLPRTLFVTAGSSVTFLNRDRVYHSVFSVSPENKFDLGKLAPGTSRKQKFDVPGAFEVFSELDPEESGYIFVVPNHAFTRVGSNGGFALPKVPAGSYRLTVWHPAYGMQSREIVVPKRGDVIVELEL